MSCDATFGNWHGIRPLGYDASLPLGPSELKVYQAKSHEYPLESPFVHKIPPSGGSSKGGARADSASSSCRASSSGSYGKGNKISRGGSAASIT